MPTGNRILGLCRNFRRNNLRNNMMDVINLDEYLSAGAH